jgi:hypothetical protein
MDSKKERMRILEHIECGEVSIDEGLRLLQRLSDEIEIHETLEVRHDDATNNKHEYNSTPPTNIKKWHYWWMFPFWVGVSITILGGLFLYQAMQSNVLGLWFFFAVLLSLLGIFITLLSWESRGSPWLSLRIRQKPGQKPQHFTLSFPLPVKPTAWFLRMFGSRIPSLNGTSIDEVILAVANTTDAKNPIYIQVDEGQDGEKVEIYIG